MSEIYNYYYIGRTAPGVEEEGLASPVLLTFSKMTGIGNDYIYVNCFQETVVNPEKLSIFMSDVRFGVGSDGLVLILPSEMADFRMRIFNADGSEAMMCGNATRCIGKYGHDR